LQNLHQRHGDAGVRPRSREDSFHESNVDMVRAFDRCRGRHDAGSLFERQLQVHRLRSGSERLVRLLDRRPGGSSLRIGRLRLRSLYLPGRHGDGVE
jgi:hypothetical protein